MGGNPYVVRASPGAKAQAGLKTSQEAAALGGDSKPSARSDFGPLPSREGGLFIVRRCSMENKPDQIDRFREAARQLETDDDEARFNDRLKKIAKAKVTDKPEPKGEAE